MAKPHAIMKHVPNMLTLFRLLLVPVFIHFYNRPDVVLPDRYFALVIFLVACATDLLDGYLARKYDAISDFGKLVDPLADKLMTLSALFCFLLSGQVGWVFVTLILVKESIMIIGGYVMLRCNIVVYSDIFGKFAAFVMAVAIIMTFIPNVHPWNMYVLYLSLVLTFIALFRYGRSSIRQLKERRDKQED